jgi:hypothetical protein
LWSKTTFFEFQSQDIDFYMQYAHILCKLLVILRQNLQNNIFSQKN